MERRMKKKLLLALTTVIVMASSAFGAGSLTVYAGQWQQNGDNWKYQNDDGAYITNNWYQDIEGKWYHFDGNGNMQTGWISDGDKEYYLSDAGVMLTNSVTPDGCYVNDTGEKTESNDEYQHIFIGEYKTKEYRIYYNVENISDWGSTCIIKNIDINKDGHICFEIEITSKMQSKYGNGSLPLRITATGSEFTLGAWHGNRSGLVLPLGKVGTTDISQLRLVIDDHATAEIRIN